MKSSIKTLLFYVVFIVAIFGVSVYLMGTETEKTIGYSDIISHFEKGEVKEFVIDPQNVVELKLKDNQIIEYPIKDVEMFMEKVDPYLSEVEYYDLQVTESLPWWVSFLPYVIVILLLVGAWIFFINKVSKNSTNPTGGSNGGGGLGGRMNGFTKARVKMGENEKEKVTFKDVAGAD